MKRDLGVSDEFLRGLDVGVRHQQRFRCVDCGRALSPNASDYNHYPVCPNCRLAMAHTDCHNLRCPFDGCSRTYCDTKAFDMHYMSCECRPVCPLCMESPCHSEDVLGWHQQHNIKCSVWNCSFRCCDAEELDSHQHESHAACSSCLKMLTPTESRRHYYTACIICRKPDSCINTHNRVVCSMCGQRGCGDRNIHYRNCNVCGAGYYACNMQQHFKPCQVCNRKCVCTWRHSIKAFLLQCEEDLTTCVQCGRPSSGDNQVLLKCKRHVRHTECIRPGTTYCHSEVICCMFDCPLCVGMFGWESSSNKCQKCCFCIRRAMQKYQIVSRSQGDTATYCRNDDKMDVDD